MPGNKMNPAKISRTMKIKMRHRGLVSAPQLCTPCGCPVGAKRASTVYASQHRTHSAPLKELHNVQAAHSIRNAYFGSTLKKFPFDVTTLIRQVR